jgi:FkbM family methyltransferase
VPGNPIYLLKKLLRRLGVDLIRYHPETSFDWGLARLLEEKSVDVVLDVGASVGRYGHTLRAMGYDGRIVSFEPGSRAHQRLERAAQGDALWTVAPRMALGAEKAVEELTVTQNLSSSSILPPSDEQLEADPGAKKASTEEVTVSTLADILPRYVAEGEVVFVKVDVQGYEDRVLEGGREVLDRIHGVQVELSTVPLYEGQSLYRDLLTELETEGFSLHHIEPVAVDEQTGRLLQFDGVFFRDPRNRGS